ncbi:MAG TPA: hypothetical protein VGG33_00240 [Polyangia bacterium]
MKQEMLLPKLRLPGQTNWLVRGLWILAGVAAMWFAIVLATLWRRNELSTTLLGRSSAPAPIAAASTGPAPGAAVPAAPALPAAPAPAAPVPAKPVAAAPVTALGAASRPGKPGVRPSRFSKRGKTAGRLGARKGGRYVAKAGARRGSKSLAARKAWAARNKRTRYARVSANATKSARSLAPARRAPVATSRPAAKGGDPIDDILKNFK